MHCTGCGKVFDGNSISAYSFEYGMMFCTLDCKKKWIRNATNAQEYLECMRIGQLQIIMMGCPIGFISDDCIPHCSVCDGKLTLSCDEWICLYCHTKENIRDVAQQTTWTNGSGDCDWNNPENWTNGVPGES